MSKITAVRTIRLGERQNLIWVEIDTDEELTGLGETFRGADAVESIVHNQIAPWLIGQDLRRIEFVARTLTTPYLGFHSAGAETRATSAADIALWDLAGQRHRIPVHEALGVPPAASRAKVRNCAAPATIRSPPGRTPARWPRPIMKRPWISPMLSSLQKIFRNNAQQVFVASAGRN